LATKGAFHLASAQDGETDAAAAADGDEGIAGLGARGGAADPLAGALALDWLDGDERARLICLGDGALVWANRIGQDDLVAGRDLALRDGIVQSPDRAGQRLFAALLEECGPVLASLVLPCADGDGDCLIRARQIGADAAQRYIGLTFHRTGSEFRALYADLDKVFCLTPAEHRVLGQLIDGSTADAIACAMRLSIETVRSHIRHIYAKLQVSSREGLFSRIRPYRL
jgi:DNA-binding CsgD family transcriptional regulator